MEGEETPSVVNPELCTGCGSCVDECPSGVYEIKEDKAYVAHPEKCTECRTCELACPEEAIEVKEELLL